MNISDRQEEVLRAISDFISETGYPPTVRELASALGMSSSRAPLRHLKALEESGYISRDSGGARTIRLRKKALSSETFPSGARLPLAGRVPAGPPGFVSEDIEEWISVPNDMAGSEKCFLLRVRGDSMTGHGILDGDIVVVDPEFEFSSGDVVVAIIDDEATIKKLRVDGETIVLEPGNPSYEPMAIEKRSTCDSYVRIAGKVTGLMRKM